MMRRLLLTGSTFLLATQLVHAEPQMAVLTHENKFPEVGKAEIGTFFDYREFDNGDSTDLRPYIRYTVIENLTLNASIPYVWDNPDFGNNNDGWSDASFGVELLAYQDIFEYPWVIPHANVKLDNGNVGNGLGSDETVTTFGVSVGTTVYDVLHYVVDVSYALNGGNQSNDKQNVTLFSGSLIWDLSNRFSVLAEGRATNEANNPNKTPYVLQGGMAYKFSDRLHVSWYGGSASDGGDQDEKVLVSFKVAYSF